MPVLRKKYIIWLVLILNTAIAQKRIDSVEQNMLNRVASVTNDSTKAMALLDAGSYFVNKPGEEQADMNSALMLAKQAIEVSRRSAFRTGEGAAYTLLAQILREKGDKTSGKTYAEKAVRTLPSYSAATKANAFAYMELSEYYSIETTEELSQKIIYYSKGVGLLKLSLPNTLKLADALKFLGDLYNVKAVYDSAATCLKESLAIYQSNHYAQLQDIYSLLGQTAMMTGQSRESLRYQLLALRYAENNKDSSSLTTLIYNRLGNVYNILEMLPESSRSYDKARLFAEKNGDVPGMQILTANLAWIYIRLQQHKKAISVIRSLLEKYPPADTIVNIHIITTEMEAHTALKEYVASEQCYATLQKIISPHLNIGQFKQNYHYAAMNLFLAKRDFTRMQPHILELQEMAAGSYNLKMSGTIEWYFFKVDSLQGRYLSAIGHYEKYKRFSDSASANIHDKQIRQLELQYQTEKKDRDIANKAKDIKQLQHQSELQRRTLKSESFARNLLYGGIIMLALLLVLAISRYRLKQHANKRLETQQQAINQQNDSLKQLLTEREWLLKEIHHRVKNNLQIVISLLNSQSLYLEDGTALDVIKESQHRMHSISLIHQKLYQGDNLSGIEMHDYIYELVTYLQDSFSTRGRISFLLTTDRVTLDVSQAVPLGLIINEAVTNAIKYAFPDQEHCEIRISLTETTNHLLTLSIADNGRGLPENFDIETCHSLGMNLLYGLSRQLGSKLQLYNDSGLYISMTITPITLLSHQENTV